MHLHNNSRQGLHSNNYPKIHSRQSQQQELAKKTGGGRRAWGLREWLPFILELKEVLMAGTKASQSLLSQEPSAAESEESLKDERLKAWAWDTGIVLSGI